MFVLVFYWWKISTRRNLPQKSTVLIRGYFLYFLIVSVGNFGLNSRKVSTRANLSGLVSIIKIGIFVFYFYSAFIFVYIYFLHINLRFRCCHVELF